MVLVPAAWFRLGQATRVAILLTAILAGAGLAGCADPSGTLIILQNQVPTVDSMTDVCSVSADTSAEARASGVFDVDLDRPYPYYVYPVVQSRLPSIKTAGGIERNSIMLMAILVAIHAPAGVNPGWAAGCPGTFDAPAGVVLDPTQVRALTVQGFQTCHAQRMNELIAAGVISGDASQPVYFKLELTAVADRSGSELLSDPFGFQIQVCAGCLQSMYPLTPSCTDAPKPNPYRGNRCNIAQDTGRVLCCTQVDGSLICPAPDA